MTRSDPSAALSRAVHTALSTPPLTSDCGVGGGGTILLVTVWGVGEHRVGVYSIASDCVGGG